MEQQILLVEDDREIARIIKDTLAKEGYHITWATTGIEGLEDFNAGNYDLILVDWMMPEMDGLTMIEHIRLQSDVPIIMISAKSEEADKVEGLQDADDYLAKPFSLEELKARVRSQLRRWKRYNKINVSVDLMEYTHGLKMDWQQERVYLNEVEINLNLENVRNCFRISISSILILFYVFCCSLLRSGSRRNISRRVYC